MSESYDALETRDPAERERDLFGRLPDAVAAAKAAPAYAERFGGVDPRTVTSRAALARLPVLRKSDLPALQRATPPFGGFTPSPLAAFGRLFTSPGPNTSMTITWSASASAEPGSATSVSTCPLAAS